MLIGGKIVIIYSPVDESISEVVLEFHHWCSVGKFPVKEKHCRHDEILKFVETSSRWTPQDGLCEFDLTHTLIR